MKITVIMLNRYVIHIPTKVVPKGRPRFVYNKKTKKPMVYTPKKTLDFEKYVSDCAKLIITQPINSFFQMTVHIFNEIPKSWSKSKKEQAKKHEIYPARNDLDNLVKSIADGLNGVAYKDDKYMIDLRASKRYGEMDEAIVIIEEGGDFNHVKE